MLPFSFRGLLHYICPLLWKYQHNYKESDNDEERNDFFHEDAPNTFLLVYCENECIMTHIVKEKGYLCHIKKLINM